MGILPSFANSSAHSRTVTALRCNQARNTADCFTLLKSRFSRPHISLSISQVLPSLPPSHITHYYILNALCSHQLKNQFHLPIHAQNGRSTTVATAETINPVIIGRTEEVACNSTHHPLQ